MKFIKALFIVAVLFAILAEARAQVTPYNLQAVTNLPAVINVTSGSNCAAIIYIRPNKGLALTQTICANSATNTLGVTLYFQPTVDGTNYGSGWTWAVPANGTTANTAVTNWPRTFLEGYQALKLTYYTNAAAAGIMTNQMLLYAYPNL